MFRKNAWEKYNEEDLKKVENLSKSYMNYIDFGKTERLVTKESVELLKEAGFKDLNSVKSIKSGDKLYLVNRNKNVVAFVIGKEKVIDGLRILGAHIDCPRIDLKQNPVYENTGFAYLDTHYYGGIKKYQWVTIPLALVGVVCLKNGEIINISIGLDEKDPVVGISDLLIHLAGDQMGKSASKVIEGENLDVTIGSQKVKDKTVKENVLSILKEKYGIEEEDFVSSEIEVVPASKSREYGLDRSMIAGYGHDDRSCSFASLKAILDLDETPKYTSAVILVDKEEVGSIGATGAECRFFQDSIVRLLELEGETSVTSLSRCLRNSRMLSSDVGAAYDPLYAGAYEANNSCYLGNGIVFTKFTGSRGKSGANDASPELIADVRRMMDEKNINYQTGEIGKVDQGGGGTIAYILGNMNIDVLDAGIPVLNMHAPMEVISKADLFEAYLAYKTFLEN